MKKLTESLFVSSIVHSPFLKGYFIILIFIASGAVFCQSPAQGNWIERGPFSVGTAHGNTRGIGLCNRIAIHPTDSNTMFALGGGALWKSTNEGNNWSLFSEVNPNFSFATIQYDPNNGNVLYAAIQDGVPNMGDIHKSTDGGNTWFNLNITVNVFNFKLLVDPFNSQNLLIVASGSGISKSTDGGSTWNLVNSAYYGDMEMNPLNPNVLYGLNTGNTVVKSTNGGLTFSSSSSIPFGYSMLELGLTVADTNYVYVFSASNSGSGMGQVALSTNGGTSFVLKPMANNLYCFNSLYHFEVSPTNRDLLIQGGISCARTTNGGTSWSIITGAAVNSVNYVHVDHRFITFHNSSFWTCNDGGINKTADGGINWSNRSTGLGISNFNSLVSSEIDTSVFLGGTWDDSEIIHKSGGWENIFSGDGFDVAIHPFNPLVVYGKNQYGYQRSYDGGINLAPGAVFTGCTESFYSFVADKPIRFNHQHPTSLFVLVNNVWKSTNNGNNVTAISSFPASGQGGGFLYVCETDSNIIFTRYYHTTNGGSTWLQNTKRVVAVDPDEPNKVWAQNSLLEPYGIYYSSNGGTTWSVIPTYDVVTGTNKMCCANNANNGVFLYSGINIYYRDDQLSNWQPFNNGLPPAKISDVNVLENFGKIRVATQGRGIWESNLFDTAMVVEADFIADNYSICPGDTIQFFDNSLNNGPGYSPTYQWSFPGGTPSTSNAINPQIMFSAPGSYNVTLTVFNSTGVSTTSHTITVGSGSANITASGATTFCENDTIILTSNLANSYLWSTGATTQSIYVSDSGSFSLIANYTGGCAGMDTISIYTLPLPEITATVSNDSICFGDSVVLTSQGDPDILFTWNNGVVNGVGFTPTSTSSYILTGIDEEYCSNMDTIIVVVNPLPSVAANAADTIICNGQNVTLTGIGASSYTWSGGVNNGIAFSPSSTATYYVTGTDVNSCSNSDSIIVSVHDVPSQPSIIAGNINICTGSSNTYSVIFDSSATSYSWTLPSGWSGSSSTNSISAIALGGSGIITISANNNCGSSIPRTMSVTVNSLPSVGANATNNNLCNGDTTTLTGTGASSYTWSGGVTDGVSFNPTSTNTYTVTGTDMNSCSNTNTITIIVNNLPAVGANATDTDLCNGDPTTLTGTGATSYTWSGGVTDGIPFNPTSTSTYTVTGTDVNLCSNINTITIIVNNLPVIGASATDTSLCQGDPTTLTGSGGSSYIWTGGVIDGVSFNPTVTNTYTVTGTDMNSCTGTSSITISVYNPPIVTANATDTSICNGDPVTLTGSGALSYSWSGGVVDGVSFSPTSSNTYTVIGTNANSCSDTAMISIVVNNLPMVNFSYPGSDTICISYGVQTLSGGTPPGGSYSGAGVAGTNFDPNMAGIGNHTITYQFADVNGCGNSASQTIVVLGCAGLDQNDPFNLQLYPNPFDTYIHVTGNVDEMNIKLYNTLGEIIYVHLTVSGNVIVYPGNLRAGIYYLSIETEYGQVTRKLLKN